MALQPELSDCGDPLDTHYARIVLRGNVTIPRSRRYRGVADDAEVTTPNIPALPADDAT